MRAAYPVVKCDGDDGMCEEFALDHTLGGLGRLVGSATQLPRGWSGDAPSSLGDKHYCPEHTAAQGNATPVAEKE